MKLSNKAYDVLKWIASTLVPALVALILGLSQLIPAIPGELIAGVIGLVGTFLGALIGLSSHSYWQEVEG